MEELSVLLKPASSLCNMRCKYCFYADVSNHREIKSHGIMSEETAISILDRVVEAVDKNGKLYLAFQGGEPTLAGLSFFRFFTKEIRKKAAVKHLQISFSLQTNGILIDHEWCEFLKDEQFLVGLSMDGPAQYHNLNRIGADGKGTWNAAVKTAQLLQSHDVPFNILCVLTQNNAAHAQQLWNYFLKNKMNYIQFIPCLPGLDKSEDRFSLMPRLFHDFYKQLYRLWHEQLQKGHYVSIKLFDDIANLLVHHRITACGICGKCTLQYIVESDGSVYPCDFYVLDPYLLGSLSHEPISSIRKRYQASSFHGLRSFLPAICQNCKYRKLCEGGCVRLRDSVYIQGDYCGYAHLLADIGDDLIQIVSAL